MSATRTLPTPDKNGGYMVLPFDAKYTPYLTSQPNALNISDCFIIAMPLLESLQEKLQAEMALPNPKMSRGTMKVLLKIHAATVKKIRLAKMGEFGKGTFSTQALCTNDLLLYPSHIYESANVERETEIEVINYRLGFVDREEITFDAKNIDGLARYFQHLPKTPRPEAADESPATANFNGTDILTTFNFNKKKYYICLAIIHAERDIPTGQLLGFDYGAGYWDRLPRFTHFKCNGDPIPDYSFSTFIGAPHDHGMPGKDLDNFLKVRHIISKDILILLTRESVNAVKNYFNTLPAKHGARDIIIPSLMLIKLNEDVRMVDEYFEKYILINLTKTTASQCPRNKNLFFIGETMCAIPFLKLMTLTVEDLAGLASYCNKYLGMDVEMQLSKFFKIIEPVITPEDRPLRLPQLLFSVNPTTLFKKTKRVTELSYPEEQKGEIEMRRRPLAI